MTIFGHRPTPSAWIGLIIIAIVLFAALLAPWIAPYDEADLVGGVWDGPSGQFLFGTDNIGRDMLSRMIFGARTTCGIALATTLLSALIGITVGMIAAALGGLADTLLSRVVDILLAVPMLILALLVFSVLGTSIPIMILTIAVLDSTRFFRLARAVAVNIVVLDFVQVARLRGERLWWVVRREVMPNAVPPLVAEFGMRFCFTFLLIASLSFLGLGVQPPAADWGSMVRENAQSINFGGIAPLFPAGAIALLTVGVNLVVDWLLSVHARPGGAKIEM